MSQALLKLLEEREASEEQDRKHRRRVLLHHLANERMKWLQKTHKTRYQQYRERHEWIMKLKEWFSLLDADGSGEIDAEELEDPMITLGVAQSRRDVEDMVLAADEDGNGNIGFDEFVDLIDKPNGTTTIRDVIAGPQSFSSTKEQLNLATSLTIHRRHLLLEALYSYGPGGESKMQKRKALSALGAMQARQELENAKEEEVSTATKGSSEPSHSTPEWKPGDFRHRILHLGSLLEQRDYNHGVPALAHNTEAGRQKIGMQRMILALTASFATPPLMLPESLRKGKAAVHKPKYLREWRKCTAEQFPHKLESPEQQLRSPVRTRTAPHVERPTDKVTRSPPKPTPPSPSPSPASALRRGKVASPRTRKLLNSPLSRYGSHTFNNTSNPETQRPSTVNESHISRILLRKEEETRQRKHLKMLGLQPTLRLNSPGKPAKPSWREVNQGSAGGRWGFASPRSTPRTPGGPVATKRISTAQPGYIRGDGMYGKDDPQEI